MTVIVALQERPDSFLVAADGEVLDSIGLRETSVECKLNQLGRAPVAWGCSGTDSTLQDFNQWLTAYQWPPSNWVSFRDMVIEKLSELNGRQRRLTALSGAQWEKSYETDCLLVGWLNGDPAMFHFDAAGQATSYLKEGFYAIGAGAGIAMISMRTLAPIQGPTVFDKLVLAMSVTVASSPKCGKPITIWRITSAGMDVVHDERQNSSGKASN